MVDLFDSFICIGSFEFVFTSTAMADAATDANAETDAVEDAVANVFTVDSETFEPAERIGLAGFEPDVGSSVGPGTWARCGAESNSGAWDSVVAGAEFRECSMHDSSNTVVGIKSGMECFLF